MLGEIDSQSIPNVLHDTALLDITHMHMLKKLLDTFLEIRPIVILNR